MIFLGEVKVGEKVKNVGFLMRFLSKIFNTNLDKVMVGNKGKKGGFLNVFFKWVFK